MLYLPNGHAYCDDRATERALVTRVTVCTALPFRVAGASWRLHRCVSYRYTTVSAGGRVVASECDGVQSASWYSRHVSSVLATNLGFLSCMVVVFRNEYFSWKQDEEYTQNYGVVVGAITPVGGFACGFAAG